MKDEEKSYLWMIQHHTEALVTLVEMDQKHEFLTPEIAYEFMHYLATQADTVWEERIWQQVANTFLAHTTEKGENVLQFSPDLRGPDT